MAEGPSQGGKAFARAAASQKHAVVHGYRQVRLQESGSLHARAPIHRDYAADGQQGDLGPQVAHLGNHVGVTRVIDVDPVHLDEIAQPVADLGWKRFVRL